MINTVFLSTQMDAAFKLKTQNERAKVEDLFEFEGKSEISN